MILCVGTSGCGKSVLLKCLQNKNNLAKLKADLMMSTIPTVGSNLVTLTRTRMKKNQTLPPEEIIIREVGGTLAPLWHSYVESGNIKGILFLVDASSPETIGASTLYIIELIGSQPATVNLDVMVVFTKTDLKSGRSLSELKAIMRLDQIVAMTNQKITSLTFNTETMANLGEIHDWIMQFSLPKVTVKK
ncbi:ADP-ribosylation factor-like protein 16 [Tigriopus californicus]|nr:ADP-ribosylation factor-like protein 16 [Tigriopus californicus]